MIHRALPPGRWGDLPARFLILPGVEECAGRAGNGLARIHRSYGRDRVGALAEESRRGGITCVVLPSDRTIATWEVEAPPAARDDARAIVESAGRDRLDPP